MLKLKRKIILLGIPLLLGTVGIGAEAWREQALAAANRLAEKIEILDEVLHEVYNAHETPEFKKAIEDIHHIENLVNRLVTALPAGAFTELCQDFGHLYEDLVAIRLDLIALGLEKNPKVVQSWNNMVAVYNNELLRYFRACPKDSDDAICTDMLLNLN